MIKIKVWGTINMETSNMFESAISSLKDDDEPILMILNCLGGTMSDAIVIVNLLHSVPNPVIAVAIGNCQSAATLLFAAASERYITKDTIYMIHQPYIIADDVSLNETVSKDINKKFIKCNRLYKDYLLKDLCIPKEMLDVAFKEGKNLNLNYKECIKYKVANHVFTTWNELYKNQKIDIQNEEVITFESIICKEG